MKTCDTSNSQPVEPTHIFAVDILDTSQNYSKKKSTKIMKDFFIHSQT
jgi:hypothetical protein